MYLRLLCAGIATCVPWTLASNPCAEASSYNSEGIVEDPDEGEGVACGNVVPSVIAGVAISAETCAEVIDPFGMGDFTRTTYLSYAAASCCSEAGSVCSAFAAQLCVDPSDFNLANLECLNWQALLGPPDTEGDAAAWCAEEVLGPSVSCVTADGNCLWMPRSTVTAFSHGDCCNGGSDICEGAVPVSTCAGSQSVWYGLHGSCPEECHGEGDAEVCTRSPNTCGTAGCEAYLSRFTMEFTEELTSGMLECDPQTDVYSLASMGAEHVHAVGPLDIGDQCGLSDAVPGLTCGEVKQAYKSQYCCGNPSGPFITPQGRRLTSTRNLNEQDLIAEIKEALADAKKNKGSKEAKHFASDLIAEIKKASADAKGAKRLPTF